MVGGEELMKAMGEFDNSMDIVVAWRAVWKPEALICWPADVKS